MTWDQILRQAEQDRRAGRAPYGKPRFTDAEIDAAFTAEFKLPSEWQAGDEVEIVTGTVARQRGVITGPVNNNRVMVLFEDNIHWSYPCVGCYVRRVT